VKAPCKLLEFVVHAVTEGIDALGEVTVRIESQDGLLAMGAQSEIETQRTFGGYGADTDIVVASVKAYLSALNKMLVSVGLYAPVEKPSVEVVPSIFPGNELSNPRPTVS
jgi:2-isopropylmalate synthase